MKSDLVQKKSSGVNRSGGLVKGQQENMAALWALGGRGAGKSGWAIRCPCGAMYGPGDFPGIQSRAFISWPSMLLPCS
jgi:hypothetical protein